MTTINELDINEKEIVRVDTTIPISIRNYIQEKGYRINELIRLGIMAKENNPQMIKRLSDLENRQGTIEGRLSAIIELQRVMLEKWDEKKKDI